MNLLAQSAHRAQEAARAGSPTAECRPKSLISTMPTSISAFPKIYYLYPTLAGTPSERKSHLDRCVTMGFTHVMVPSMLLTDAGSGTSGDEASSDRADLSQSSESCVQDLARDCQDRNLALLLDMDVNGVDPNVLPAGANRGEDANNEPPDPRKPFSPVKKQTVSLAHPDAAHAVVEFWQDRLQAWVNAGSAGFCCRGLADVSPAFWRELIDNVRGVDGSVRFLAWTPGCTPEQLSALTDCGFDATFSSAAWWNYKAAWLAEEHERLEQVAPSIAFPDSPLRPVIYRLDDGTDDDVSRRIYQRALKLAASTGCGMLLPMGFEFGLSGMLDVIHGSASDFADARKRSAFDLSDDIAEANAMISRSETMFAGSRSSGVNLLTVAESNVAALLRYPAGQANSSREALLIVANADLGSPGDIDLARFGDRARGFVKLERLWPASGGNGADGPVVTLEPGELQVFAARRTAPIASATNRSKRVAEVATRVPRIAIEEVTPSIDGGRFPVKRVVGELIDVEADAFMDGHDKIGVALLWRTADEAAWQEIRMKPIGNDRWRAVLPLQRMGRHFLMVEAWRDAFATYRDELVKKVNAGLDVSLELEEGRLLVLSAVEYASEKGRDEAAGLLKTLAGLLEGGQEDRLGEAGIDYSERIAAMLSEQTAEAMRQADSRPFVVRSEPVLSIDAERTAARFSSWYELFPRSQSGDPSRHGTFGDVEKRLPAIREMGFDTLYFPPIHPIGKKNRKGRNNTLTPTENDPGSPYAIGSEEGGHDAIHPELGTLDDFRHLRDEAAKHGLELALDFAIQCSPDHPWLKEHPEWFAWRPDGSLRYAENPPKKYEDIVNVDFYAEGAIPGLWIALRDVILFWVKEGVRVFRVDNPHTKPLPFWQWMIGDIRARFPDTIFLSEAFTKPKMMYRLAKVGFSQSYTYFTWRHTKAEFTTYMTELTTTSVRDHFRPHFFVNTPDINPVFLQQSGRPGFLIRAALATTLSGLWGMYSGFELCEATPVPGKEDYLDSEKYEIRAWDWQRPGNIIREITVLNRIRSANPALQTHLGIRFYPASNDNILYFIKSTPHPTHSDRFGDNVVLVAINLDPFTAHATSLELPLWQFGLPDDGMLEVDDLVNGNRFTLRGKMQNLRLDPFDQPYAIWCIQPQRV
jgi:starch synthase (maltosyl-transferring)